MPSSFSKFAREDPTGKDEPGAKDAYALMTVREKLPKFNPGQKGYLSTKLEFTRKKERHPFEFWKSDARYAQDCQRYSKTIDFYHKIPTRQCGYYNLNHRPRERNPLYMIRNGVQPPIRRRSPNLYNLEVLPDLLELESSFDEGYQYKAQTVMIENYPMFTMSIHSEETSLDLAMFMLLLPIALEKARMTFLLKYASRHMFVTRIGNTSKFTAVVPGELSLDDITALSAAVGCSVLFLPRNVKGKTVEELLFVTGFEGNVMSLTYPSRSGFTKEEECLDGPQPDSPLHDANNLYMRANFLVPVMEFKLLETGVIDAITTCGHYWFEEELNPNSGKPLINREQLERLRRGEGFHDPRLTDSQKEGVVTVLESAGTIKTLLGGGGCGKTASMDESILQLVFHHTEDTPSSALILLAVPTNLSAETTIARLLGKGFPPNKLLHVLSEQAPGPRVDPRRPPKHKTVRITQYQASDEIQLIVGTVQVLPRLAVPKITIVGLYNCSPLMIVVEEVCAATAAEVLTLLISSGEPQQILLVGDHNQLRPRYNSRLAQIFYGEVTMIDLLKRRLDYFELDNDYPTPRKGFGVCLTENHRANSELVALASSPFYAGMMTAGAGCEIHDKRTEDLRKQLKDIPHIKDLGSAYLWLDGRWPCKRNAQTLSLFNCHEADFTSRLLFSIGEIVGYSEVVVLTPYTAQVDVLKTQFREYYLRKDDKNRNVPAATIGSVDEFQGMESSIVIISLVRSTKLGGESSSTLGFLSVPERINSMITRARHMVIIVGSQDHFTAGESNFWDFLISKAATRRFQ